MRKRNPVSNNPEVGTLGHILVSAEGFQDTLPVQALLESSNPEIEERHRRLEVDKSLVSRLI